MSSNNIPTDHDRIVQLETKLDGIGNQIGQVCKKIDELKRNMPNCAHQRLQCVNDQRIALKEFEEKMEAGFNRIYEKIDEGIKKNTEQDKEIEKRPKRSELFKWVGVMLVLLGSMFTYFYNWDVSQEQRMSAIKDRTTKIEQVVKSNHSVNMAEHQRLQDLIDFQEHINSGE